MKSSALLVGLTISLCCSAAFGQSASSNTSSQTSGSVKAGKVGASASGSQQTDANVTRQNGNTNVNSSSRQNASANANVDNNNLDLDAGSQIDATMQSALDSRHATNGQQFVMKTNKDVKSHGKTVIKKGSTLVGHVVNAQSKTQGNGDASMLLAIDGVQQGNNLIPLQANFVGMVRQSVQSVADTDVMSAPMPGPAPRGNGGGGGLLGGVGSTVNNTVGGVANAAGSATGAVHSTVSGATSGVGNATAGGTLNGATQTVFSLGNNTIASTSSVQGATQFTKRGGDLKLDKGSEFLLSVTGSAQAAGSVRR